MKSMNTGTSPFCSLSVRDGSSGQRVDRNAVENAFKDMHILFMVDMVGGDRSCVDGVT